VIGRPDAVAGLQVRDAGRAALVQPARGRVGEEREAVVLRALAHLVGGDERSGHEPDGDDAGDERPRAPGREDGEEEHGRRGERVHRLECRLRDLTS
jgi:hypothetical protein